MCHFCNVTETYLEKSDIDIVKKKVLQAKITKNDISEPDSNPSCEIISFSLTWISIGKAWIHIAWISIKTIRLQFSLSVFIPYMYLLNISTMHRIYHVTYYKLVYITWREDNDTAWNIN